MLDYCFYFYGYCSTGWTCAAELERSRPLSGLGALSCERLVRRWRSRVTGRSRTFPNRLFPDATFRPRPRPVGAAPCAGIVAGGRPLRRLPRIRGHEAFV
ncbi:hypothetical protein GCM10027073_08330 [Streptomyces chlorus]